MSELYPLRFKPVYKDYLWGGDRIVRRFQRALPPGIYAESWEIADHPDGMSIVENGPLAGRSLHDLVARFGADLLGAGGAEPAFPLLVKIIDARQRLSVQVHPDARSAGEQGGDPKTEMWYVLEADPGAGVFAGFQPEVTPAKLQRALAERRVEDLLNFLPLSAGEAVYIPGGRVHTIDAGCLLLEIQQRSNTTYRLYDWDRVGPDGKRRPLHIERALKAIRWNDREPARVPAVEAERMGPNLRQPLIQSPFFSVERWTLTAPWPVSREPAGFRILFLAAGRVTVEAESFRESLVAGTTCLLPAARPSVTLRPETAEAEVLLVSRPRAT